MLADSYRINWSLPMPRTERVGGRSVLLVVLPISLSSVGGVVTVALADRSVELAALPPVSAGISPVGRVGVACLSRGLPDAVAREAPGGKECWPACGCRKRNGYKAIPF